MAEVKNSFISSKMNKDLDDRLVPNNQYRDALNVLVGKSIGSDTGVLQSIAGNQLVADLLPIDSVCIGAIADHVNNRAIVFLTNYEDPSPASITPVPTAYVVRSTSTVLTGALSITLASVNSMVKPGMTVTIRPFNTFADTTAIYTIKTVVGNTITLNKPVVSGFDTLTDIYIGYTMQIVMYSAASSSPVDVLAQGDFLNFANNNVFNITGVNILEDLLFWTDNRNQPRKINIRKALSSPGYYNREDLISVAKYNPVSPITLFKKINAKATSGSTSAGGYTTFTVSSADGSLLKIGDQLITSTLSIADYIIVYNIVDNGSNYTITLTTQTTITNDSNLTFYRGAMMDESSNPNWKGDTSFLKDKYIRFSYRYKFNDGEYSLIAPFSQIIYIPLHKGYFFGGDETNAYTSTVLSWMENMVNSVIFTIELPQQLNYLQSDYGIEKIEILYKESDSLKLSVLETVDFNSTSSVSNNILTFQYNSQKPYKTLPSDQITRVYDKVPIRAKAQEISGNRVIYGNFIATNTSPSKIDYLVSVNNKSDNFNSWIEYPNHTLKQNRTYQVGIVLSDKFGRQSPVILSSSSQGSTAYAPFSTNATTPKDWIGDALNVTFNSTIESNKSESSGEPGLYATISGTIPNSADGFQVAAGTFITSVPGYGRSSYNNSLNIVLTTPSTDQKNLPALGGYLKGEYTDYVKIVYKPSSTICIADGTISSEYLPKPIAKDVKYAYSINPMGWYSYKVVVKQQQQEYYNVYLPGMLNGYPSLQTTTSFPTNEINRIAHTVLINDNINKVPRDLTEVGPDQKQYRSSVNLFCRVNNIGTGSIYTSYNTQYFPSTIPDVVSTIATSTELNFLPTNATSNPSGTASVNFYQLDTKPSIARITTVKEVGTVAVPPQGGSNLMIPTLSVYETAPDISLLDIYWESTTAGYISDLNEEILLGEDTVANLTDLGFLFFEYQNPSGSSNVTGAQDSPFITDSFWPTSNGTKMTDSDITLTVVNKANTSIPVSPYPGAVFEIAKSATAGGPTYRVKIVSSVQFLASYLETGVYTFTFNITDNTTGLSYTQIRNELLLRNNSPTIATPPNNTEIYVPTNSPGGNLQLFTGNNGSSINSLTDCNWSIASVSPVYTNNTFDVSNLQIDFGYLSAKIGTGGTYNVTARLRDAYNGGPTNKSLSDDSTVIVKADNFIIPSVFGVCKVHKEVLGFVEFETSGQIDVWRSLRPGESIADTSNLWLYYANGYNPSAQNLPESYSFSLDYRLFISYTFRSIVSFGTAVPDNFVNNIKFYGYFTTTFGRNIVMNSYQPPSQTTPFGYLQSPTFIYDSAVPQSATPVNTSYRPSPNLVNWTVTNNGPSKSWFQGLYSNLNVGVVRGNYVDPGSSVTSNTIGQINSGTIYTEQGADFVITYT